MGCHEEHRSEQSVKDFLHEVSTEVPVEDSPKIQSPNKESLLSLVASAPIKTKQQNSSGIN